MILLRPLAHGVSFRIPFRVLLGVIGQHIAFHVMHVFFIITERLGYDGHIHFHVHALSLQSLLGHDSGFVRLVVERTDGSHASHLGE